MLTAFWDFCGTFGKSETPTKKFLVLSESLKVQQKSFLYFRRVRKRNKKVFYTFGEFENATKKFSVLSESLKAQQKSFLYFRRVRNL